jgi:DNA-binding Lrp family transcriptional regulator
VGIFVKVYTAINTKPGGFRSVIEGLQDKFPSVRIDGIIGLYELIFCCDSKNETEFYEHVIKPMMVDQSIKSAQSYVVLKSMQKDNQEAPAAYIFVHLMPGSSDYVQEKLFNYPEVLSADIVVGDWDLISTVSIKSISDLWKFLGEIAHISGVCRTVTAIVPKAYRK